MRRQRFVFVMSVLFALITVMGIGCKNQFLEKPTFGSPDTSNSEQTTGSAVSFGAPSGLKATQGGYREITLSWNPVTDAVRYYVYRANTQFDTFVQVGETGDAATSYTMKVQSGADFYYRVTAVNYGGKESGFSAIVRGTALAQPLVSGIEGVEGKEDSDVTVYWYMGNVDAYQNMVRYNVICYDSKGTELARTVVDGSKLTETAAVIKDLVPNTTYTYAVEAYLVSAQDKVEKCEPIDAVTARRLRPNAPEELVVQQGQSKDGITLSFKLPALVDVALPGGLYEQKPLYFKIYRREYEAGSTDTEKGWVLLKADFGKTATVPGENEIQKVDFGNGDEEYTPGAIVTWTDENKLNRGVKYEYKVQSFAYYERDLTSKYSASIQVGWLIAKAEFRTGKYEPVLNEENSAYISATLGFNFKWDAMGLDDDYHFILEETRFTLEGDSTDSSSVEKETIDTKFNSIAEVNAYVRKFNNLNDDTQGITVRGYYRYTLTIFNKNNTEILVLNSPGRAVVTNSVNVPVIKLFSVSSGYKDKIELQWEHNSTYNYTVEYTGDVEGVTVQTIERDVLYNNKFADYKDGDIVTYTHTVAAGKKLEYILRVSNQISTDSLPIVGRTSQTPSLERKNFSYDALTVEWQDVPAKSFTIAASYKDGSTARSYPIDPQEIDGNDADTLDKEPILRTATFNKPNGYTHATVSGKPVEITITAKVPVTRTVHTLQGDTGSSYDIVTQDVQEIELKNSIDHYTMGPAMVAAKADLGVHSDKIQLTWKKVEGANAYVVIRNGFHISASAGGVASDSVAHLDFKSTDMYLIKNNGGDTWQVIHKPSEQIIEKYFSVAFAEDTFTLTDNLYTDADSTLTDEQKQTMGQWISRQKEISWGAPYKYTVLPILTETDVPVYDYEISPALATLDSIGLSLTDLSLVNGTTMGYAWNVKATKGTYSKNGENTGVKLTWTRPFTQASEAVGYNVYRAEYDSDNWVKLDKSVEYGTTTYVDESATPGVMYQYMVATGVTSDAKHPNKNAAWVEYHNAKLDENYTGERLANGFTLPRVPITVTRQKLAHNDATGGKEKLTWNAQSVAGKTDYLFDGYIIEILNHNISGDWQRVAKLDFGGSIQKSANYTRMMDNANGLLKVLRDYKHYFRVRTYVEGDDGEIVSKDDYQWADGKETDFVKWGARSLSADEFARVALVALGDSMVKLNVSNSSASCNNVPNIVYDGGIAYARRWFDYQFESYQSSLKTVSGKTVNSVKITGRLGAFGAASVQWPTHYWTSDNYDNLWATSDKSCPITIVFSALPDDSDIKTGTIHLTGIYRGDNTITSRSNGAIKVNYAGYTATINQSNQSQRINIPFPYYGDNGFSVYNSDEWK